MTTSTPNAPEDSPILTLQRIVRHLESGNSIRYEFPPMMPMSGMIVAGIAFFACIVLPMVMLAIGETDSFKRRGMAWQSGVISAAAAGGLIFVVSRRTQRTSLRFHPGGVCLERHRKRSVERRDFAPRDLVSLEVVEAFKNNNVPVPALELQTSNSSVRFATGIPQSDAEWVRWDFSRYLQTWAEGQGQPANDAGLLPLVTRLDMRAELDGSRRIEIRPLGRWPKHFWIVFAVIALFASQFSTWSPSAGSEFIRMVNIATIALFAGGIIHHLASAVRNRLTREALTLSPHVLVHDRAWLWHRRREIPADEVTGAQLKKARWLQDGQLVPEARLIIYTSRKPLRVGVALNDHDQQWLLAEVQAWISSRQPAGPGDA